MMMMVVEMAKKEASHYWWFDSHYSRCNRSPWLHSTLLELENKTKAMLKLIEQDADSFAQRAEMYYKKRPELISMVEDFYRAHRSLLERYDQLKSDPGNRILTTTMGSSFSNKSQPDLVSDESCDSQPGTNDQDCSTESEVDDPHHDEIEIRGDENTEEVSSSVFNEEMTKLREEIERLKEESRVQRDQLLQKDEEKREVIRQLSLAMDTLKLENVKLRKHVGKVSTKRKSRFDEFEKLKDAFFEKLFNTFQRTQGRVLAL